MTQNSAPADDFGALLASHERQLRTEIEIGERIKGTVVSIDRGTVFVDFGGKSEGLIDRSALEGDDGELTVAVGDTIEAYCVSLQDDEVRLALSMTAGASDGALREAYEAGIPVEGRVEGERKGGYEVRVGPHRAFCPYSQIDTYRQPPAAYIGTKLVFLVTEYGEHGRNLVLSRRRHLERERERELERLKQELEPGDIVSGTVTRIMPFGVFVALGSGIEGLVPMRELSWSRGVRAEDLVKEGVSVTVSVIDIDWDRNRITLSLRGAQDDPWESFERDYHVGQVIQGTVTRLMPFGAFVEIEPGVEGLLHVSRLGQGRRINHPQEVLEADASIRVSIEKIDRGAKRISLALAGPAGDDADNAADSAAGGGYDGTDDGGSDLGSLGDVFAGLDL